jgi:hypothetical protein
MMANFYLQKMGTAFIVTLTDHVWTYLKKKKKRLLMSNSVASPVTES